MGVSKSKRYIRELGSIYYSLSNIRINNRSFENPNKYEEIYKI